MGLGVCSSVPLALGLREGVRDSVSAGVRVIDSEESWDCVPVPVPVPLAVAQEVGEDVGVKAGVLLPVGVGLGVGVSVSAGVPEEEDEAEGVTDGDPLPVAEGVSVTVGEAVEMGCPAHNPLLFILPSSSAPVLQPVAASTQPLEPSHHVQEESATHKSQ